MTDDPVAPSDEALQLAPELTVRVRGDRVVVDIGVRSFEADTRIFPVLSLFVEPRSLRDAFAELKARGAEAFIETTSLILRLRAEGVLSGAGRQSGGRDYGFAAAWTHIRMLDDATRTRAFLAAVRETVRPGDVVVEIGSGTGILAIEAARAGAARVYAIEQTAIADAAEAMFAANGVSSVVRIVRGTSTEIELPERCDVLVSETLGNDPLAENIVPLFADAQRRFLKPGARLIPRSLDVLALPVDIPAEHVADDAFTAARSARWRELFGIDFGALPPFSAHLTRLSAQKPQAARGWTPVGDPIHLAHFDLASSDVRVVDMTTTFIVKHPADNLGLIEYFEASLSATSSLTTAPSAAADDNAWTCEVFRSSERPRVKAGDEVRVEFSNASGVSKIRAT